MTIPNDLQMADLEPVGPGTLTGRYLRTFWQPVYRAKDLPRGKAIPLEVLGEQFTLYRGDDGSVNLVGFRCAHRGTQLSLGWVEGNDLRCRYHGWKFDAAGQCVEQPNEDKPFCARVKIPRYPTQEYAGLIFAYLGDGAPPPFRQFPDLDQPGVIVADPVEILLCSFWNKMDNDPGHIPWVHRHSLRRMGRTGHIPVGEEIIEEAPWGLKGYSRDGSGVHRFVMPNVRQWWPRSRAQGFVGQDLGETKTVWTVPINDQKFASFDVTHTPFEGAAGRAYAEVRATVQESEAETRWDLAEKILAGEMMVEDLPADMSGYTSFTIEDYVTQVGQGPIKGRGREQLCSTDRKTILIRRLWMQEIANLIDGRPLAEWKLPAEPYATTKAAKAEAPV